MEDLIKTEIEHIFGINKTVIDNGTDFKDFQIQSRQGGIEKTINILFNKKEKEIEIQGVKIKGIEIDLLKQFLNQ